MKQPEIDLREVSRAIGKLKLPNKVTQTALMQGGLVLEREIKLNITNQGLIDTGKMRASVAALTDGINAVIVAVRTFYAVFHEYGTRKMRARPFMRPAIDTKKKQVIQAIISYLAKEFKSIKR